METSRYFERTLFYDLSPTAEEYYTQSADAIFEKDPGRSHIEVRIQSSIDASCYDKTKAFGKTINKEDVSDTKVGKPYLVISGSPTAQQPDSKDVMRPLIQLARPNSSASAGHDYDSERDDVWSLSSRASSTALPTVLDHHRGSSPPMYPGLPKLGKIDLDIENIQGFVKRTKHNFRVFYIRQRHSFSRLQITKDLFEKLLRSCHVFPRFNEYVIGLGSKNSDSEVTPPPLKYRPLRELQANNYQGYECSYLIRYVEYTNRPGGRCPYSLRQFAVYHRYKPRPSTGCSTWIIVGSSGRTEKRLDEFTHSIDDLMASNPFELHVIFLSTAIASWKPYIGDLKKIVTRQSDKAVGVLVGGSDSGSDFISIEVEDHQELKQIEDQIAELILCLDSTLDTVTTFQEMYKQFCDNYISINQAEEPCRKPAYENDAIMNGLRGEAREIAQTRKIAESLLSKVQNTRTLISSLLERESGHNLNQQISALQTLEIQGQEENTIMRGLTEKNSRDSSSMRILTIITMIYLPCTIVSNFYSTQFVSQKEQSTGGTKLEYAQNAYIFFAISAPLTLLTIVVWYVWVNYETIVQLLFHRTRTHEKGTGKARNMYQGSLPFAELPR
ncbi:hypothetical protein P280DRAFT_167845 [Massarina eburnea CBS 473.64]|uniref:CorA-like transporter domain-containing protein n=1 Tax=Massarina eburnea CBS 473.64 TaxID=1395130 RepID=A0A6A6RMZ6_9PLEO|nr:hypothetical protein P280DRAFT_167845 [Massarina eburnea CBS 473.64]